MAIWWQLAILAAVAWLVLRFVRSLFKPREPSESVEDPLAGVPFAQEAWPAKSIWSG